MFLRDELRDHIYAIDQRESLLNYVHEIQAFLSKMQQHHGDTHDAETYGFPLCNSFRLRLTATLLIFGSDLLVKG